MEKMVKQEMADGMSDDAIVTSQYVIADVPPRCPVKQEDLCEFQAEHEEEEEGFTVKQEELHIIEVDFHPDRGLDQGMVDSADIAHGMDDTWATPGRGEGGGGAVRATSRPGVAEIEVVLEDDGDGTDFSDVPSGTAAFRVPRSRVPCARLRSRSRSNPNPDDADDADEGDFPRSLAEVPRSDARPALLLLLLLAFVLRLLVLGDEEERRRRLQMRCRQTGEQRETARRAVTEIVRKRRERSKQILCHLFRRKRRASVWALARSSDWWERGASSFPDTQFRRNFGMSRSEFEALCRRLAPALERRDTTFRLCVPVRKRVAMALWKIGSDGGYKAAARLFGVSITTVWRCVQELRSALEGTPARPEEPSV